MGKILALLSLLVGSLQAAPTPTNSNFILITNWTKPSGVRVVSNQVYNVQTSQKWETVDLPAQAFYRAVGYKGVPKAPVILHVTTEGTLRAGVNYNIRNYPFDPADFNSNRGNLYPSSPLRVRLLPLGSTTNWYNNGKIRSIDREFDYGLPYTQLVPQVVKLREPVTKYEQYSLAMRYLKGDGVAKDETEARTWLQKSAAQGYDEAKTALAKLQTHSNP